MLFRSQYQGRSLEFGTDLLERENVLVVPGISFTPETDNYFRINILLEEAVLNEAFGRIAKLLF